MYRTAFAILLLFALVPNADAQNNWAAAACAGLGPRCPTHLARTSGHCFARLWMSAQPGTCRRAACNYCRRGNRRVTKTVCKRDSIVKHCFKGQRVQPKRKPNQSKARKTSKKKRRSGGNGKCRVFVGSNNKVVIPANRLKLTSHWTRNGDGSMTWRRNGGHGIDPAGSGTICARFKVPSSGTYYMSVISKAPHPTEYNDAWFKLNAGFRLYRPQGNSWKGGGSGWMKGYQNEGRNIKANYIVTIDFNGHQFISNPLARGREYQLCVSGRSAKYTIFQLILIKCKGSHGCNRSSSPIRNAMRSLPPSRC